METFAQWLRRFNWLNERDLPCIISADLDGMACGLFQQEHLNWRVQGTYDGNVLALWEQPDAIDWARVVFLDIEILRPTARSIGNHLLAADSTDVDRLRTALPNCANPNLWRGINVHDSFQQKYPFASLPLLVAAHLLREPEYRIPESWLAIMLQADSGFTNAARYPSNALKWLNVMGDAEGGSGIAALCRALARLSAHTAIEKTLRVKAWTRQAGFGRSPSHCRFNSATDAGLRCARRLIERIQIETEITSPSWFGQAPCIIERFESAPVVRATIERSTSRWESTSGLSPVAPVSGRRHRSRRFVFPNPASCVPCLRQ